MLSVITFTVTGVATAGDGRSTKVRPSAPTRAMRRRDIRTSCGGERSAKPIPQRPWAKPAADDRSATTRPRDLSPRVVTSTSMETPIDVGEEQARTTPPHAGRSVGAAIGVLAAMVALGTAELLAAFFGPGS